MGHATHFLQRLDRIDDHQVELALALYRDDDLLQSVLASIELAPGTPIAQRVAVSLDHPVLGPFVVLTPAGRFVTCLGHGMRVKNMPVVTRERFEIASQRVQRMRDELERVRQLREAGGEGQAKRILNSMGAAGPRFCREDAVVLARVQPLIAPFLAPTIVESLHAMMKLLPMVATQRFDKLSPLQEDAVLTCGRLSWFVAHALPFLGLSESRQFMSKHLGEKRGQGEIMPAALTFGLGTFTHSHRALWLAARSSGAGVRELRHLEKRGPRLTQRLFRELGLGAIACASGKRRVEAIKALFDELPTATKLDPEDHQRAVDGYVGTFGAFVSELLKHPEPCLAVQRKVGEKHVQQRLKDLGVQSPYGCDPHVPEDIARAAVATLPASWLARENAKYMEVLAYSLPWLARAPLEELYLPREWARVLLPAPGLKETLQWLKPFSESMGLSRPKQVVRETPKILRNDPCSCGSGKKAKRCCRLAA